MCDWCGGHLVARQENTYVMDTGSSLIDYFLVLTSLMDLVDGCCLDGDWPSGPHSGVLTEASEGWSGKRVPTKLKQNLFNIRSKLLTT